MRCYILREHTALKSQAHTPVSATDLLAMIRKTSLVYLQRGVSTICHLRDTPENIAHNSHVPLIPMSDCDQGKERLIYTI